MTFASIAAVMLKHNLLPQREARSGQQVVRERDKSLAAHYAVGNTRKLPIAGGVLRRSSTAIESAVRRGCSQMLLLRPVSRQNRHNPWLSSGYRALPSETLVAVCCSSDKITLRMNKLSSVVR